MRAKIRIWALWAVLVILCSGCSSQKDSENAHPSESPQESSDEKSDTSAQSPQAKNQNTRSSGQQHNNSQAAQQQANQKAAQQKQAQQQQHNQKATQQKKQQTQPQQLGYYETDLLDAGKPRITNINLCIRKVNGKVLQPGEEFSFNKTVGRRTEERGYKKATVFRDNKEVKEVGGGICQLSSTIYCAALDAGLQITERHEHQLPVDYVPKGKDATVYYGKLDLRFQNNLDIPIKISCSIKNRKVIVAITTV